ncbi:unnamed protein product [Ectocarpus sp. CCAP 1310/34]|nr:unnamed protein product [Ectocarpus sp. CCAP 1310/34]
MMVALVHHSPDDDGRHETGAWVFVSSDPNHDFDFHIYAMDIILQYYIRGDGRAATAGTPIPKVKIFADGCAKQYKGKRNFHAVAKSLHRLGAILIHNFAVTSQFKGAHDGIGGLLKALLRVAENRGQRIHDTQATADFLKAYAEAKEDRGGHFSTWFPYRIKSFHIKLLGHREIPRPIVDLTGISGSSKLYQFMGAEVQQEESSGVGVEADESIVLTLPAVTKRYELRVRQASCCCSKCSVGAYDDCFPARKYAGVVGMVKAVSGKHKATILPEEHENVLKRKDTRLAGKDNGKGGEVGDKGGKTGERGLIDDLCDLVAKLSMPDSVDVTDARKIPGVLTDNLFVEKNSGLADVEVRNAIKTWLSVEDDPSVLEAR